MQNLLRLFITPVTCLGLSAAVAHAEEDLGNRVMVELNTVVTQDNSCTLTFMVINGHEAQIDQAIYETVLFDQNGQVDRLTLFDFATLPPGRPRVRQFALPDTPCDSLGRILFNGVNTCSGDDLPDGACDAGLDLRSRVDGIEVIG